MKKLILIHVFLVSLGLVAQNDSQVGLADIDREIGQNAYPANDGMSSIAFSETFEEAAKRNKIAHRKLTNLQDVEDGYYIIAGIFSRKENLKKTVRKFTRKGFAAGYITNSENGLNYVYLEYHPFGLEAVDACSSKLNGRYKGDMWILEAEKEVFTEETIALEKVDYEMLNNSNAGSQTSLQKEINTPRKTLLIQKADQYFDKMWYAEAAELYEEALKKGKDNYSFDIIQKAGDAHYFNTNMEKAFHWYDLLYKNYKDEMSADNIFKYAHSLKGTGKYARSKRLMRLYGRKMKKGDFAKVMDDGAQTRNEMVLDKILGAEEKVDIHNLSINSKYSEFSPMFMDSNQVVFASSMDSSFFTTRRYKWNNQPYLDLYVAKMNEESQDLRNAVKYSKKINTKYHEASVTFSPDNSTMYFTRNNYGKKLKRDKNGVNHLKIYMSKKVNGDWTEAVEVPFNSDNYSTGHPALSPDGKQLYFVSDMPGSIGQTDIFVVDVLGDGDFSEPRNLGPTINTERKEMFPFISAEKLYFSSDGHVGLGGLDIYEAAYEPEEGFGEVVNLGKPINSNKDDFSYIVNEGTLEGFFASNRPGGKGDDDIYSFKRLVVEEVPENLNAIAGVVTEMITGEVMPKALIQLLDENGIKLKEVITEDDGSFVFEDLDGNTKYTLKTTRGEFFDNTLELSTKENERLEVGISMRRLKEMIAIEDGIKKLKTDMIHFDFDKSYIRKDAAQELDKLVEVMNEYPDMVIKIESHTDSRGSRVYNEYLSDKRAKSSRDYLISRGIAPERIESAKGFGESQLLNECDGTVRCSEANHYLNRRSEFIIVSM
ncbi:OmpA family protein [Ulvibacterium sp.]|uniref:OmpA family protein n=1 Tax=Ulvibacterium sp. TaxID=2665914 RepID=UPI00262E80A8|nr:OmpA family protein [Ulvibacterium sp.]